MVPSRRARKRARGPEIRKEERSHEICSEQVDARYWPTRNTDVSSPTNA
jgi:hypothetical protein